MTKKHNNLEVRRHSLAHVLAAAVLDMFPEAKFGIGPAIENGFYYDFDLPRTLIPEDLLLLENKMREIIKANYPFERKEISKKNAVDHFKKAGQPYKVEILNDIEDSRVSIYKTGPFVDLCAGPHIDSTGEIDFKSFTLSKIAGAYWKGSEKNKMLQRVYGLAFQSKKELGEYLTLQKEIEKRDHRKIGKDLEIFTISDVVGKGLPLWLPKGATIRRTLERFIVDEELARGYEHVYSPVIGNVKLYKMSGHWDHYRDNMYAPIKVDGEEYILRPMSCPHHLMMYKSKPRSYKELPVRYAELAPMYRKEKSGELTGLIRVMGFTLADAHIMCTEDQLKEEFQGVLDLIQYVLKALGLEKQVSYRASLRDKDNKKYVQDDRLWDKAEKILLDILEQSNIKYEVGRGEAAFYGPKLDVQIRNIHGKEDTIITNQIDFVLPQRFDLTYIDRDAKLQRPVIIHRSSIGAIERTIAFLLEHHAGALPLWLSPIQATILAISEAHVKYAKKIYQEMKKNSIRVSCNTDNESVGKKIREAELQKIPYIVVIGDKEMKSKKVAVRERGDKRIKVMSVEKFTSKLEKEIKNKN